ncbi:MAG: hypothetical protein M3Z03_15420 [Actinomycetota bacterium]|nr:hypothetical protein [Actinomycetota bacterium]
MALGLVTCAVIVGCGDEPGDRSQAVPVYGPGSELVHGLVVPEGTELVYGTIEPPPSDGGSTIAVLRVTGADPLDVWDAFADQAHEVGFPLQHSAWCQWLGGGPSFEQVSVVEGIPDRAEVIDCNGFAIKADGTDASIHLQARLWWSTEDGAELGLSIARSSGFTPMVDDFADPGPAPDSVHGPYPALPEPARTPSTGEPFGRPLACFQVPADERSGDRFRVPSGASVVADLRATVLADFLTVLEVDDPRRVLSDLAEQLGPPREWEPDTVVVHQVASGDGEVWALDAFTPAGGGNCNAWATPDSRHVIVTGDSSH